MSRIMQYDNYSSFTFLDTFQIPGRLHGQTKTNVLQENSKGQGCPRSHDTKILCRIQDKRNGKEKCTQVERESRQNLKSKSAI